MARTGITSTAYRPQLDSVRAIAILPVLAEHFWLPDLQLSSLGVRLFFVLSGFLLTRILVDERDIGRSANVPAKVTLINFYARRVLRIWPAYYFALGAAVCFGADAVRSTLGWHALFASNFLFYSEQRWFPEATAPLWSLAVEEQFYLVLPLLLLFITSRHLRAVIVAAIVAGIAYRSVVALTTAGPLDFYFVLPVAQLDALGAGALLALVQGRYGPIKSGKLAAFSILPAILVYGGALPAELEFAFGQALYLLPMIALVSAADAGIGGRAGDVFGARPVVAFGRISYGIYLYHMFVAGALDKLAMIIGVQAPEGPARFATYSIVTTAVAAGSWMIIERPALALRRHFRTTAPAATVPTMP